MLDRVQVDCTLLMKHRTYSFSLIFTNRLKYLRIFVLHNVYPWDAADSHPTRTGLAPHWNNFLPQMSSSTSTVHQLTALKSSKVLSRSKGPSPFVRLDCRKSSWTLSKERQFHSKPWQLLPDFQNGLRAKNSRTGCSIDISVHYILAIGSSNCQFNERNTIGSCWSYCCKLDQIPYESQKLFCSFSKQT